MSQKNDEVLKFFIRKNGSVWEVSSKSGKVLGKHPTRRKALQHLRAIEANKNKKNSLYEKLKDSFIKVVEEFKEKL